jgi:hypothetical protein
MNQDGLKSRSLEEVKRRIKDGGPPGPQVVFYNTETEWDPDMMCSLSEYEFHVLGRSADIIVYFDPDGNMVGWRDDGRKGSEEPGVVDEQGFLEAMIQRLELPMETRLSRLRPVELPPIGWTHEGILFLSPVPEPEDILRVWVDPMTLRVIQILYDRSPKKRK